MSYEGRQWYVDLEVHKTFITPKCLERIGESFKYNTCYLQSNYVLDTDVPDIDDRVARCIPPFLKYICYNWARY